MSNNKPDIIAISTVGGVLLVAVLAIVASISALGAVLWYKSTPEGKCEVKTEEPEVSYTYDTAVPLGRQSILYQADKLDLDMSNFEKCIDSSAYDDDITKDTSEGYSAMILGTPGFYIGERVSDNTMRGFIIPGAYPYSTFQAAIEAVKDSGVDSAFVSMRELIYSSIYDSQYDYLLQSYNSQGVEDPDARAEKEATEYADSVWQIREVGLGTNPPKGDESSPVVIVEFTDFECPFCKRHVQEVIPSIDASYIENAVVVYYLRDYPLEQMHDYAKSGAIAARCAGEQGKYWEMHDLLFGSNN